METAAERFNELAKKLGLSSYAKPFGEASGNFMDMFEELALRALAVTARVQQLEKSMCKDNTEGSRVPESLRHRPIRTVTDEMAAKSAEGAAMGDAVRQATPKEMLLRRAEDLRYEARGLEILARSIPEVMNFDADDTLRRIIAQYPRR